MSGTSKGTKQSLRQVLSTPVGWLLFIFAEWFVIGALANWLVPGDLRTLPRWFQIVVGVVWLTAVVAFNFRIRRTLLRDWWTRLGP